jgi:hypothetical protein
LHSEKPEKPSMLLKVPYIIYGNIVPFSIQ